MNFNLFNLLNLLVLVGAMASALVAVHARRILDSIIALGAAGSFMAVEFLFLQAPDVAIAEAAVGAVLGTVLYIIALRKVIGKGDEK
ncbi:MAG: DUF4040 domain-containing protein [Gemmiger sp.]|nr:DUF4040 domain-containing protein [Gemmiger sp.]